MRNRSEQCAFFNIIEKGTPKQRQDAIERMCESYCKEECPVIIPDLEFTEDNTIPYKVIFDGKIKV